MLSLHVVVLIKDLNGNHVIQKCLNKLAPEDNQDPYGNYVVQYILDLNDNRFSDGVICQFAGNVCALSVQKFSSNVIEKYICMAEHSTRKMLIKELLNHSCLEKLLRDSYGNYCIQTALDYVEPTQCALLVEGIHLVLQLIRNTPYGKHIQNKLQREQVDNYNGGYHGRQMINMNLNSQALGLAHGPAAGRHLLQSIHPNGPIADIYASQASLYGMQGQGSYGLSHLAPQLQCSIDGYVLQNHLPHNASLTPLHTHAGGYFWSVGVC
ncbi:armadillo-type protein [Boletus reticuloceps]|uniref:Armadillo-type protein n=1 Tax=Boletus reticuloceps TaxID=495285 RepID=A0A8I2YC09_9AGAM|nr:armadillo-type protein [Boletus reticuloceps]